MQNTATHEANLNKNLAEVGILRKEGRYCQLCRRLLICIRFLLQKILDMEFAKEIAEAALEAGSGSDSDTAKAAAAGQAGADGAAPVKEKKQRANAGQRKPLTKYQVCLFIFAKTYSCFSRPTFHGTMYSLLRFSHQQTANI